MQKAISKYGKPAIFNTDQGSQFTAELFVSVLLANGIQPSMDGKGRAIDNIFVERLWRSVKYEDIYLKAYADGWQLEKGMSSYFNFYNQERMHQSLDYKTPQMRNYYGLVANSSTDFIAFPPLIYQKNVDLLRKNV